MKVITPEGVIIQWTRAVLAMEDDLAESLRYLYPCTEQSFFTAYCHAHKARHGSPFTA